MSYVMIMSRDKVDRPEYSKRFYNINNSRKIFRPHLLLNRPPAFFTIIYKSIYRDVILPWNVPERDESLENVAETTLADEPNPTLWPRKREKEERKRENSP